MEVSFVADGFESSGPDVPAPTLTTDLDAAALVAL
jgi:hypothetical protein